MNLNELAAKVKQVWLYLQDLANVKGGPLLALMTLVYIGRVIMSAKGYPGLNASEAAVYASAMGALAVTNR